MTRLVTPQICTMTELREPQKVLDRAGSKPVAILKNTALVGYLVPAEAIGETEHRPATLDEVIESLTRLREINQPVLDYPKDE
jgi:antitoxin StbD